MTVTTPPADLAVAAARYSALGLHAYARTIYMHASNNAGAAAAIQVASIQGTGTGQAISPALVGYDTSALQSTKAGYATSAATELASSQLYQSKGHDGSTLTG